MKNKSKYRYELDDAIQEQNYRCKNDLDNLPYDQREKILKIYREHSDKRGRIRGEILTPTNGQTLE